MGGQAQSSSEGKSFSRYLQHPFSRTKQRPQHPPSLQGSVSSSVGSSQHGEVCVIFPTRRIQIQLELELDVEEQSQGVTKPSGATHSPGTHTQQSPSGS